MESALTRPFRPSGRTSPPGVEITSAVEALFCDHYEGMCRLTVAIVGSRSDAEDVVMEVFTKLARRTARRSEEELTAAYVRGAVVNEARSLLRRRLLALRFTQRESAKPTTPETPYDTLESRSIVLKALQELPLRQRTAIVLRYYEGLSEAEVASTMGCSLGTAKSHLARARRGMLKHLGNDDRPTVRRGAGRG